MRFPEFEEEWEVKKLREIATKVKKKNIDDIINIVFSNSAIQGIVLQNEYFDKEIANRNNLNGYYIVAPNDFVYNPRLSSNAEVGAMNINKTELVGLVSPLYTVFNIKDENIDVFFIEYIFKSKVWHNYMKNVANYGARDDRMNIKDDDLFALPLFIPKNNEQTKITSFLSLIDERIVAQSKIIEGLKELKASLSKQIFSRKLRFKDENGHNFPEWRNIPLSDVVDRITQKNNILNTNVLTISAQMGLVNQLIYYKKNIASKDLSNYYVLSNGDFAYNKSYSTGYPFGAFKRLDKYTSGIVSPLYICFRSKNNIDSDFLVQYFEAGKMSDEIQSIAQEGARNHGLLNVGITDFFSLYIEYPSIAEQQKIASVLSTIDEKTEIEKKIREQFIEQKKHLLKQMFI